MQQTPTTPIQNAPGPQQDWKLRQQQEQMQTPVQTPVRTPIYTPVEYKSHYHAAGVPVWGLLLIAVGVIALLGNFGLNFGWLFGLALGAWFVYLGVRSVQAGQQPNWWLVGIGLLIGLGSITPSFASDLVFPIVLIVVGAGILALQYAGNRQLH